MHVRCQSLPQFLLHAVHYCYKVDCNYYNSQYQRITYLTNRLKNTNLIGLFLLIHLHLNYSNSCCEHVASPSFLPSFSCSLPDQVQ